MTSNEAYLPFIGDAASRVTLMGLAANVGLTILKGAAGFYLNSAALIADAGHSLSGKVYSTIHQSDSKPLTRMCVRSYSRLRYAQHNHIVSKTVLCTLPTRLWQIRVLRHRHDFYLSPPRWHRHSSTFMGDVNRNTRVEAFSEPKYASAGGASYFIPHSCRRLFGSWSQSRTPHAIAGRRRVLVPYCSSISSLWDSRQGISLSSNKTRRGRAKLQRFDGKCSTPSLRCL